MADEELPDQIPTSAAFVALKHVLSHGHDGLDPIDHFAGVLMRELDLGDSELAAAEEAVVKAMTTHPRSQAAIDEATRALAQLKKRRK